VCSLNVHLLWLFSAHTVIKVPQSFLPVTDHLATCTSLGRYQQTTMILSHITEHWGFVTCVQLCLTHRLHACCNVCFSCTVKCLARLNISANSCQDLLTAVHFRFSEGTSYIHMYFWKGELTDYFEIFTLFSACYILQDVTWTITQTQLLLLAVRCSSFNISVLFSTINNIFSLTHASGNIQISCIKYIFVKPSIMIRQMQQCISN